MTDPRKVVVLISGTGSNLASLIASQASGELDGVIVGVLSNKADALGLKKAQEAGIKTQFIDHRQFSTRESFDQEVRVWIDECQADLVVLAGFMRILSDEFVQHYKHRMINIHPSLLPKHKGLRTHQAALDANDQKHGCTVHFVSLAVDSGLAIAQAKLTVSEQDNDQTLAKRVLEMEHRLLPLCVQWFCSGRLTVSSNNSVLLDGEALPKEGMLTESN